MCLAGAQMVLSNLATVTSYCHQGPLPATKSGNGDTAAAVGGAQTLCWGQTDPRVQSSPEAPHFQPQV